MGRRCLTCNHPQVVIINQEIQHNVRYIVLSKRFDDLSYDSIRNHGENHVKPMLDGNYVNQEKFVKKFDTELRPETNFAPLHKNKVMQHNLMNRLDTSKTVKEYLAVSKELRMWVNEQSKLEGRHSKYWTWEQYKNWSDTFFNGVQEFFEEAFPDNHLKILAQFNKHLKKQEIVRSWM